jgi:hypothetical protein
MQEMSHLTPECSRRTNYKSNDTLKNVLMQLTIRSKKGRKMVEEIGKLWLFFLQKCQ